MRACVCGCAWLRDVACVSASLSPCMHLSVCSPNGDILPRVFYMLKTYWASFAKSAGDLKTLHVQMIKSLSLACMIHDGTHPVFSLPISVHCSATRTVADDSAAQSSVVAQLSAHAPGPWKGPSQDKVGHQLNWLFWGYFCQAAR